VRVCGGPAGCERCLCILRVQSLAIAGPVVCVCSMKLHRTTSASLTLILLAGQNARVHCLGIYGGLCITTFRHTVMIAAIPTRMSTHCCQHCCLVEPIICVSLWCCVSSSAVAVSTGVTIIDLNLCKLRLVRLGAHVRPAGDGQDDARESRC
jgi:hypothetical protein